MNEELKPCPFCGNEAIFHTPDHQGNIVGCPLRHASMRSVEGWNTRVESTEIAALKAKLAVFARSINEVAAFPDSDGGYTCPWCGCTSWYQDIEHGKDCVTREALAIIDGTTPSNSMELEGGDG